MVRSVSRPDPEVPALKAAVAKRMAELGLSPTDLSQATGITVQGLLNLRQGRRRNYQARLTGPVCRVLGWTPDSIDRLLAGKKPIVADDTIPADELARVWAKLSELERQAARTASELRELAANQEDLTRLAHQHVGRRRGEATSSGRPGV